MIGDANVMFSMASSPKKMNPSKYINIPGRAMGSSGGLSSSQPEQHLGLDLSPCSPGQTLYESPSPQLSQPSPQTPRGLCSKGFVFELPPQYEQSNDLSKFDGGGERGRRGELGGGGPDLGSMDQLDLSWGHSADMPQLFMEEDEPLKPELESPNPPTAATESLFDDIQDIIMNDHLLSSANINADPQSLSTTSNPTPTPAPPIPTPNMDLGPKWNSGSSPMMSLPPEKSPLQNLLLGSVTEKSSPLSTIPQAPSLHGQLLSKSAPSGHQFGLQGSVLVTPPVSGSGMFPAYQIINPSLVLQTNPNPATLTPPPAPVVIQAGKGGVDSGAVGAVGGAVGGAVSPGMTATGNVAAAGPSVREKKRSISPESDGSNSSMDRRFADIFEYIGEEQKIKVEKPDVAFSPMEQAESQGEDEFDSDAGSDNDSDAESITSHTSFVDEFIASGRGKERKYFWQYNMQSKGPKGKRLCRVVEQVDPHVLNEFEDPVFDPELNEMRYKHNGKARRGDGNDVTPNPRKLYNLGVELSQLNRKITGMTPVSELPAPARTTCRREKNKYASRACRLKKKAQHEANKIKYTGLKLEHNDYMKVLGSFKHAVQQHLRGERHVPSFTELLNKLCADNLKWSIAGNSCKYVNKVLEDVALGNPSGRMFEDAGDSGPEWD